ncbi:helix-turn-helix transcriptional regulator [Caulobacter sp. KR2-114]|uniref:helix-turn-helix transcriptional regulator n=1 Tax=Caulobacter sp. KR2-114 TaxID=3400912 RepID=UPI003C12B225
MQLNPSDDRYLSTSAIVAKTSLSRITIWRLVKAGDFPPPIKLSSGRVAYSEAEVNAWLSGKRSPVAA